jgi:hypothetical protein
MLLLFAQLAAEVFGFRVYARMVSCQCLLRNPGKHRFLNAFTGILLVIKGG